MEKLIALTMGDPAGVGPEIILKVMNEYQDKVIIYGSTDVLSFYNDEYGYGLRINRIEGPDEAVRGSVNVIDPNDLKYSDFKVGEVSAICGHSAYLYLERAIHDALDQKVSCVVTCPLNKEALHLGGHLYAGHTEILAELTGTKSYAMLLWSDRLRTIHVSTHVSLAEAIRRVKKSRIVEVIRLGHETLRKGGYEKVRIAVAGVNPHAGENGLFGNEEIDEIIPAIEESRKEGLDVYGPLPPDTVFLKAYKGEYDLVVSMYHDQGHIPLKLMDFDSGVNITCGLPFIRTSVDHGTAFDIAGKNIARKDSLVKALQLARKLAE